MAFISSKICVFTELQATSKRIWVVNLGILLYCIIYCQTVTSQDFVLGTPTIENHTNEAYGAGAQCWDVSYGDGHVFFANNGGLVTYTGKKWQTLATPNNTIMRSLCVSNSRIYIGAQNELGYFRSTADHTLSYVNLMDSLGVTLDNLADIWALEVIDDHVYFASERHVNVYYQGKTKQLSRDGYITHMAQVDNQIWYHIADQGVYVIRGEQESTTGHNLIEGSEILKSFRVIEILEIENTIYFFTEKNGIFTYQNDEFRSWENNASDFLQEKRISSAYYEPEYGLFVGTYLGGLLRIDLSGKCKMHLDKKHGLQNNSVNCVSMTPNGILWVGTNNGIDEINLASSFTTFYPDNELEGAVYDMDKWSDHLYFSTSHGLYSIIEKDYYNPLQENRFTLVEGTNGQTWGTDLIQGKLYCAHHEGPKRIISSNRAVSISHETSAWKFVQLDNEHVALGHYQGVSLYSPNEKGNLEFRRQLTGMTETSRIVIFDKHKNLWVSHPYKNVYKINFTDDFTSETVEVFTKDNGFQTDERNYVFNVEDECYLTNPTGVYRYDEIKDRFDRSAINDLFQPNNHVRTLVNTGGQVWCITDQFTAIVKHTSGQLEEDHRLQIIPDLSTTGTYIGGFEVLFPIHDTGLIVASEEGVVNYDLSIKESVKDSLCIRHISLTQKDSIIYEGYGGTQDLYFQPDENALRFEYHSLYPETSITKQYSTRLEGSDTKEWSKWSTVSNKEFTNLEHGSYVFEVKSVSLSGELKYAKPVYFQIERPWYQSLLAYLIYAILVLGSLLALVFVPRKKYQVSTAMLEEDKRKAEAEIEQVKKEKLESEIQFKNRELASTTLHLLQKNQTLDALREKIDELSTNLKTPKIKSELNSILSIFRRDMRLDEDWGKISLFFVQVHQGVILKLKNKYPQLTTNDHKLCAYLKMNLTTKEIAPLLNISVRGVEISRYRLRKKLNLERSVNLNTFFDDLFEV